MRISDIFSYLNIEVILRNDTNYSPEIDVTTLDIEYINGDAPTNEQFHEAASAALKQKQLKEYSQALQVHIDNVAREKNYENGFTCATYANSSNQSWQAEAQAFITWRDLVWEYAIDIYDEVEAGLIEPPTLKDFIENSPVMVWPS